LTRSKGNEEGVVLAGIPSSHRYPTKTAGFAEREEQLSMIKYSQGLWK